MQRFYALLLVLVASVAGYSAQNAQPSMTVNWPVPDRSAAVRGQATVAALKEVIVRTSGTKRALDAFYVQESYKKAASFLNTYAYQEVSDEKGDEQLQLAFQFDPVAVQRLLQDSAVPMWSGSRPVVLFWIAYEEQFDRSVVSSGTPEKQSIKLALNQQTTRRGIPSVLPLMDLEDSMQVTPSDVWGRFPDPIENGSTRYGTEAIIAGRIAEERNGWAGRFLLNVKGREQYQDFSAPEQSQVIGALVDWMSERLCDIYCVKEEFIVDNQWQLLVKDIGSFSSYRGLLDYLEGLSAIRKAEVAEVKERDVLVTVDLVGDIDALIQAMEIDNKLYAVSDPLMNSEFQLGQNLLVYQWRP